MEEDLNYGKDSQGRGLKDSSNVVENQTQCQFIIINR